MGIRRAAGLLFLLTLTFTVTGCDFGKKKKVFAALDNHRIEYGRCEIMGESKLPIGGKPAWLAAVTCKAKHTSAVLGDLGTGVDNKSFQKYFDAWKHENGAKAVADARALPPEPSTSGSDCPQGAACINRCRAECESKHGPLVDQSKLQACIKAGRGAACVTEAVNRPGQSCFLSCRGL